MHVLSVSSLKGGVGKTTVTLGLASAAFARGLRTLVVDLDPQCDASTGLGAIGASKATVADVLKNPRHNVVLESIVPSSWGKVQSGHIDVMIGSPRALVFDVPSPTVREVWKLEEALSRVENDYDLVLIDTPPSMNGLTRTAWVASDRVLVVSEPSIFSVVAAERALRAIEDLRRDISPRLHSVGVLINRLRPLSREHDFRIQELKNMLGNAVLEVQLEEKSTIQQAQGAARPIHTWPGDGARNIAIEFEAILDFIESSFAERDIKRTRAKATKFAKFRKIMRGQRHQAELTEDVEALLSDTAESVSRREES